MDLSFARRLHRFEREQGLELGTLLARVSAAQAASPTAQAQMKLDRAPIPRTEAALRVALFAEAQGDMAVLRSACFAVTPAFSSDQPQ